jgi:hypothetical protein
VGRVIAQAVSHWRPTVAGRVRLRGICGGQSVTGAGFLRVLWFLPPIIPLTAPHTYHHHYHRHHPSSRAGTIGQIVTDLPSGLSLTSPQETKYK